MRGLGPVAVEYDGTLERFTGDGLVVYFDEGSVHDQVRRGVTSDAEGVAAGAAGTPLEYAKAQD